MSLTGRIISHNGPMTLAGVPEGLDASALAELARATDDKGQCRIILHIARDDARMELLRDAIAFFDSKLKVLRFPAWDCQPYDRVAPKASVVAERVDALSRLVALEDKTGKGTKASNTPLILLTTVNAAMQRVPTRDEIREASFAIRSGEELALDALQSYLGANGYERAGQVAEPGEFAVRGGLVDIFPPGADTPLRIDLFGSEVETIRHFDPLTQRSGANAGDLVLKPASEFSLTEDSCDRFRRGYRECFGSVMGDDPLYEAVSDGRRHQGMEHWLPLFHEGLETLFDYLPNALVTLDHLMADAVSNRFTAIADYYSARVEAMEVKSALAAVYKPLPPDQLYLTEKEWSERLAANDPLQLSPFIEPESEQVVTLGGKGGRNFAPERSSDSNVYDAFRDHAGDCIKAGKRVVLACYSNGARERLSNVLAEHGVRPIEPVDDWAQVTALESSSLALAVLPLEHGFESADTALVTETDLLGDRLVRRAQRSRKAENFLTEASSLSIGDLVVHISHGVGRFAGLETITAGGAPHDCLKLVYKGDDRLFLPVENIEMLSRFGADGGEAALDRLGSGHWQLRRANMKKRIREMADELIKIAAERQMKSGPEIAPPGNMYQEFAARFPYSETPDQAGAIRDVLADLQRGQPMDRLVCGDVGFGKTEVALRSAFVAVMAGLQVAIVTPTTLLARQHYQTFSERFAGLPVRIEQLSRLVTQAQAKDTREGMADGQVDIVIGTHALLAKKIKFRNLGLIVVDEEQHFGVAHKEQLKHLKAGVHVLTMTATPIPRTLQLALSGIRELSLIATPPVDRLAVRTFVLPFDPVVVREALMREHYRGGQSFYVCPRISDLKEVTEFLKETVPEVRLAVAHGQMPPQALDDIMTAFYEGRYEVLVSTTIIESGLDIPSVNTMIVHRADMFGLGQLYQLRGRVGRSKLRAYAYLTVPQGRLLTEAAEKRLAVLQALDTLGAGFSLASHDMDIRGAGNLLGEEQSGHIREVGVELYQQMLEEAVANARGEHDGEEAEDRWSPQINLGATVLIPEHYVGDLNLRMALYRRLGEIETREDIDGFAAEMIDRFGPLPPEVEQLLSIIQIKGYCRRAGIEKIEAGPKGATFAFHNNVFADPAALVQFIANRGKRAKLRPDQTLVFFEHWADVEERLQGALGFARAIARLAEQADE